MIEITAISLAGGQNHEHVAEVLWRSAASAVGRTSRQAIVDWLSASSDNRAVAVLAGERVQLAVVHEPSQAPYLRARRDGEWTDTLLELPRF